MEVVKLHIIMAYYCAAAASASLVIVPFLFCRNALVNATTSVLWAIAIVTAPHYGD